MIDGEPRSATVTVDTPLTTAALTSWEFRPLLDEEPALAQALLLALCRAAARFREGRSPAGERSIRRSPAAHREGGPLDQPTVGSPTAARCHGLSASGQLRLRRRRRGCLEVLGVVEQAVGEVETAYSSPTCAFDRGHERDRGVGVALPGSPPAGL